MKTYPLTSHFILLTILSLLAMSSHSIASTGESKTHEETQSRSREYYAKRKRERAEEETKKLNEAKDAALAYECPICSRDLRTNERLEKHIKTYHPDLVNKLEVNEAAQVLTDMKKGSTKRQCKTKKINIHEQ